MNQIEITPLGKNIYRLQEDNKFSKVDAYLVCGGQYAVVIDGLESAQGLYDLVRKITDKPVSMIVTHGHPDHAGTGMQDFMNKGCDIYISFKDLYMLEKMYGKELKREQLHDLKDGMRFELGGVSLSTMAMPGHTKGSMLLFMEREGILFSSDAIGSGGLWMQLRESSFLTDYLKEVEKLERFLSKRNSVKIYTGHSWQIPPYAEENQDYIDLTYVRELKELTEDIIAGRIIGKSVEIPMEEMKGIDIYSVQRCCITDYCYNRQHISKEYSTYIFDFDYTLGDSAKGIEISINYALDQLGYKEKTAEEIKKTIGMSLKNTLLYLTGEDDEEKAELFSGYFKEKADEVMVKNTELYPSAKAFLSKLKSKGCQTAIVTTKFHYRIKEILAKFDMEELIDLIVGAEDVKVEKPSPEGLLYAAKQLKADIGRVLYIGDSLVDAQAADLGKVDFAGVLTGTTKEGELSKYKNVCIAENLKELEDWLFLIK